MPQSHTKVSGVPPLLFQLDVVCVTMNIVLYLYIFSMESESGICPDLSGQLQLKPTVIFVKGLLSIVYLAVFSKVKAQRGCVLNTLIVMFYLF